MCGLFGTILPDTKPSTLEKARKSRDTLTHRGPDQDGEWTKNNIYLGHRRLSILDLSDAGRQPMVSEDQKMAITVNGEIYNYLDLKKELEIAGYTFSSASDSEVVLHGYRHWGVNRLAEKIDGMYAVIIYDHQKERIYGFRDRVGIKPLYYFKDNETFTWASELQAILEWIPEHKKEFDNTALYDFLLYRYIPAPKSAYKNIFKLRQAHILEYDVKSKNIKTTPYWTLPFKNSKGSEEKIKKLIKDSVKEQMVSDVPIGFLLSGGIDSSITTLIGSKISSKPMTFSIGFSDPQKNESEYAKLVSELCRTDHFEHILDEEEMEDVPKTMQNWFVEPFADTSAVPTYKVCHFAKEKVTVALSGDGGDELFGGYTWYEEFQKLQKCRLLRVFMPSRGIKFPKWFPKRRGLYLRTIRDPLEQYAQLRAKIEPLALKQWRAKLNIPDDYDHLWAYRPYFNMKHGARKAAQIVDFHTYLPDDILTKVDRASMAVSLECRPPFLSKDIVEYAYSLPEEFIYKDNQLKGALKVAFLKDLPAEILFRKKQGFSVPYKRWKKKLSGGLELSIQEVILKNFLDKESDFKS